MRRIIASLIALSFLLTASTAWSIQGYKDRHGTFVGGSIGGGPGSVQYDDQDTGLEGRGNLGLATNLIFGAGATSNVLFGAEVNNWTRTTDVGGDTLTHMHWSFNAMSNIFLVEGLFVEGGLGLAYGMSDTRVGGEERSHSEMGLALKAGTGFEYFVDGTVAAGLGFGYTRHFYSNIDFDTFIGSIRLRWY